MKQNKWMEYFIDESGNSGDNLLDEQKYFSMASVGIKQDVIHNLEFELKKTLNKIPTAKIGDLKTQKTIGTKNEPYLKKLIDIMLSNGVDIQGYILEKKFMICGRIVEELLDPLYNSKTNNSWTWPSQNKKDIANYFYDVLSEKTIVICSNAFTKGEIKDIKNAFNMILSEIKYKPFKIDIANLFVGVETELEEISNTIKFTRQQNDSHSNESVIYTPNFTTFYCLINKIEYNLHSIKYKGNIHFDYSRQFNNVFSEIFTDNLNKSCKTLEVGGNILTSGFKYLHKFNITDSQDSIGVQMSDLFASSFTHLIKIIDKEKKDLTSYEQFLLTLVFELIELNKIDLIMSNRLITKCYNRYLVENMKNITPNYHV